MTHHSHQSDMHGDHMHTYDEAGDHAVCPVDVCFWNEAGTWSADAGRYV